jgi:Uncharacterized protein conserved in bacteria (DUF2188)
MADGDGLDVHVVPTGDAWTVTLEGETEPRSRHDTEQAAVDAGRAAARSEQSTLLIHGHDGEIRERDSYRTEAGG